MKNTSNNSEFDLIRVQINCADGSAEELIEKSADCGSIGSDFRELIDWLQESQENRDQYNRLRRLDGLVGESVVSPDQLDPIGFAQRLKMRIDLEGLSSSGAVANSGSMADSVDDPADYQALFDESDEQEQIQGDGKIRVADQDPLELPAEAGNPGRRGSSRKWWITSAASLMVVALSITIAVMWNPTVVEPVPVYTAEMLCDQSLDWNPNGSSEFAWNQDVENAPGDRLFPAHLIRHQARSWRRIQIEGDDRAIVYNLVPDGHLSELKAYLYVFKTDKDYQLPSQFGSHPNANRKYKFWSLACQQDLVFVLVYEGDEKRLHDLVKRQDVG